MESLQQPEYKHVYLIAEREAIESKMKPKQLHLFVFAGILCSLSITDKHCTFEMQKETASKYSGIAEKVYTDFLANRPKPKPLHQQPLSYGDGVIAMGEDVRTIYPEPKQKKPEIRKWVYSRKGYVKCTGCGIEQKVPDNLRMADCSLCFSYDIM